MRSLFLSILWVSAAWAAAETPSPAEVAYAKGTYAEAAEQWREEISQAGATAPLLAALGNAEWKLGRKGRAMICWERALLLNPYDPVAAAGLRHAQNAGGVERPASSWYEDYARPIGANAWLLLAVGAAWTGLLCLLLPRLRRQPAGEWNQRMRMGAVTVLALCIPGLWGAYTHSQRSVVRRTEVSLRLTPTTLGEPMIGVAEGDVVRAGRGFNGHIRVTTAAGKVGWVRVGEIEPVATGGLPMDLDSKGTP